MGLHPVFQGRAIRAAVGPHDQGLAAQVGGPIVLGSVLVLNLEGRRQPATVSAQPRSSGVGQRSV